MLIAIFYATLALSPPLAAAENEISGPARVIDANTLDVAGDRIDLYGIRAPGLLHDCRLRYNIVVYQCGVFAKNRLAKILGSRMVRCEPRGRGNWGRIAAICRVDGEDLGERLVREGWALADRRYDLGYVAAEDEARRERRSMWMQGTTPRWSMRRLGQGGGAQN